MKTTPDSETRRLSTTRSTVKATSKSAPRKAAAKPAAAKSATGKPAAKKTAGGRAVKGPAGKAAGYKGAAKKGSAKKIATKSAAKRKTTTVAKTAAVKPAAKRAAPVDKVPEKLAPIVATLRRSVLNALEELKAKEVKEIDIRARASFADLLIIASGTSTRHVKSLADEVVKFVKKAGMMPLGVEGEKEAEWVLVDLGDIVCHIMLPRIREFYALERLWSVGGDQEASND